MDVEGGFWDLTGVLLAVGLELGGHLGDLAPGGDEILLHLVLFGLQELVLLPLALARVVCGQAVSLDTLDAALLLLVLGLCAFPWGQVRLGLWEHLPPRLALLDGLAVVVVGRGARGAELV